MLLSGTTSLDPSSVRGIAQLVASSVPGLQLSKVTITDASGQLLWPQPGGEGASGGESGKQAAQQRYDATMAASLDAMLAQTLGPGKAQVLVYANMNVDQTTQESLDLRQGRHAPAAEQDAGDAHRLPAALPPPARPTSPPPPPARGGKSNYKHEITNTSLGVNKTVTHSTSPPGLVESQHVSVLLDHSVPAASLPAIREAVTNAAGIQTKRGDTISIGQVAFAKPTAPPRRPPPGSSATPSTCCSVSRCSVPVLHHPLAAQARERRRSTEPVWLRELEAPIRLSELERETADAHRGHGGVARRRRRQHPAGTAGTAADAPAARSSSSRNSNPDRVAQQLRSWMQED